MLIKRFLPLLLVVTGCESAIGPSALLTELPRSLTAAEQAVIGSSNRFAFDLFRVLGQSEPAGNVVVSPLSVSMALGMAMNGAAGETWSEMRDGLRFEGLTQEEINASYRGLIDLLLDLDPATRMEVANSIWYARGFPFESAFFDATRTSFDAEVRDLDFTDPGSARLINDWVRAATHGRIPDIVDAIDPNDVMYLINAIYFKAQWRQRFDPARTQDDTFRPTSGEPITVRMMNLEGEFPYAATSRFQTLDLPYGNGAFTMTIVLPAEEESVSAILDELSAERWAELTAQLTPTHLAVSLPRFEIEYGKILNPVLKALGIQEAFTPYAADFTRMSSTRGRDLYISEVLHKTFIQVDEEGTEAAAATKTTIRAVSLPPSFRADRPFVFALRERLSGTILFLGRIERP